MKFEKFIKYRRRNLMVVVSFVLLVLVGCADVSLEPVFVSINEAVNRDSEGSGFSDTGFVGTIEITNTIVSDLTVTAPGTTTSTPTQLLVIDSAPTVEPTFTPTVVSTNTPEPINATSGFTLTTAVRPTLAPTVDPELARVQMLLERYVRNTPAGAQELAWEIDFKPENEYEHPSNMCGPLTADIVNEMGFLHTNLVVSEFWKATPTRIENLLKPLGFEETYIETDIGWFDFSLFQLKVGDVLYLYGGAFDHIIVVTHFDELGRPHSITNVQQQDGTFLVLDVVLFDEANPELGMFHVWSTSTKIGRTGKLGFYLYRMDEEER